MYSEPQEDAALIYILQKTSNNLFSFEIISSNPHKYSNLSTKKYPKTTFQPCLKVTDIAPARVVNSGFWFMLYKMVCSNNPNNPS